MPYFESMLEEIDIDRGLIFKVSDDELYVADALKDVLKMGTITDATGHPYFDRDTVNDKLIMMRLMPEEEPTKAASGLFDSLKGMMQKFFGRGR